ncbi:MAG: hypothetical protein AUH85_11735 [Chloroflexi bacterium 13_1_40CM_4_68_4]|nr:MAG: hypothetical protein AUH85_11735 [Chloroflexi bacterium 13_1_40CM_4_68_4]
MARLHLRDDLPRRRGTCRPWLDALAAVVVALGGTTPLGLVLRVITAMLALAMAIVSVAGLRSAEAARRATTRITLQHATGGQ